MLQYIDKVKYSVSAYTGAHKCQVINIFLCKAHILNYLFADYLNGFKCLLKPFGIYVLVITSRPHFTQNPLTSYNKLVSFCKEAKSKSKMPHVPP
jgi:hypothetical protein